MSQDLLLNTIQIEEGPPYAIDISAKGDRLLAGFINKLILWDLETGAKLAEFNRRAICAILMPDGRTALSTDDHKIQIWDLEKKILTREVEDCEDYPLITSLAVSQNARVVMTGFSGRNVHARDLHSGKIISTILNYSTCRTNNEQIALSADGKMAALCHVDGLYIWEIETHRSEIIPNDSYCDNFYMTPSGVLKQADYIENFDHFNLDRLQMDPSGKRVLSICSDGLLSDWDLKKREVVLTIDLKRELNALSSSNNGKMAAVAAGADIILIDLETPKVLCRLHAHTSPIWGLSMTPDNKKLVSISWEDPYLARIAKRAPEKSIKVWNVEKCMDDYRIFKGNTNE